MSDWDLNGKINHHLIIMILQQEDLAAPPAVVAVADHLLLLPAALVGPELAATGTTKRHNSDIHHTQRKDLHHPSPQSGLAAAAARFVVGVGCTMVVVVGFVGTGRCGCYRSGRRCAVGHGNFVAVAVVDGFFRPGIWGYG